MVNTEPKDTKNIRGTDPEANIHITGDGRFEQIPLEEEGFFDRIRENLKQGKGRRGEHLLSVDLVDDSQAIEPPGPHTPIAE